jgi:hypothetical protein
MTTRLDLSIAAAADIYVDFQGWPASEREQLIDRIAKLFGVTGVSPAGGSSGAYVYFDPKAVVEDHLLDMIKGEAKAILPGHAWPQPQST